MACMAMQPRELYFLHGPTTLGETELLSLVLGTGTAAHTTREIAARLLDRFGGLKEIADAPVQRLADIPGVGAARAIRIHAGLHLGQRSTHHAPDRAGPIRSPEGAAAWLRPQLCGRTTEEIHALFLDAQLRPAALRRIGVGIMRTAMLDPRQVLVAALTLGAPNVILAHNHPSGALEPSAADEDLTTRLTRAGESVGITLVDHLIIAGSGWRSIARRQSYPW